MDFQYRLIYFPVYCIVIEMFLQWVRTVWIANAENSFRDWTLSPSKLYLILVYEFCLPSKQYHRLYYIVATDNLSLQYISLLFKVARFQLISCKRYKEFLKASSVRQFVRYMNMSMTQWILVEVLKFELLPPRRYTSYNFFLLLITWRSTVYKQIWQATPNLR